MQRYFLAPKADAPGDEQEAHARAQQQRLDRWDVVLEGDLDARLSLCRALASQQRDDVEEALLAVADDRQRDVKRRGDKGALTREELAWIEPVWPEGLAVLRLAARDGLVRPGLQIPGVPPVVRVDNSHVFHPDAWRSLDFRPVRRPGPG